MKRFLSFGALLLIMAGLLVSCYENVIEGAFVRPDVNEKYYDVNDKICILKEEAIPYIEEKVTSDSLLVFSGNTPEDALPKVGVMLYVPVSDNTPYGFLARVVSIEKGSSIKIHTETLPIEEVFDFLSIDTTMTVINEFEGVFDDEGNPIVYEIIDTSDIDLNDFTVEQTLTRGIETMEITDKCVKFPINIYEAESGNDKVEVSGAVYAGIKNFKLDLDVSNHSFKYLNFDTTPFVKLAGDVSVTSGRKIEKSKRLAQLRFKLTVPTPLAGVPLIIPVTIYVYGTFGAAGELGATLRLQYDYECKANVRYKNGSWGSDVKHGGFDNKSPWVPGKFDVNGEIYAGSKIGVLVGLYSATSGIGVNTIPKIALGTSAELSSEDLLKVNPEVYLSFAAGGEIYCVAELFGWKLGKYTLELPELTIWKGSVKLLPEIEDFEARGSKSSADISWKHDSYYFLLPLGVHTGTTVYESDGVTEVRSYTPSPTHPETFTSQYAVNAAGLQAGKKYYAAPYASWGNYRWYDDKVEFTTEASYNLAFRCSNWDYDAITFSFSLAGDSAKAIDYTTEATDYDGSSMRVHITAQYNEAEMTLTGLFDFFFYDDPAQQRVDGFTVSLKSGDSGYVSCSRVVDNGGCPAALRIYSTQASSSVLTTAPIEKSNNCNIGIFNKHYAE